MAAKEILFHSAAQEKVLRGAHALADAVRLTLGPRARSVLIERKWGKPLVCDDGVTIAKELTLHDPVENMGAQMMLEAAEQTGTKVGDGTTTAVLLAYSLYAEGLRNVVAGASALALKRGMERGLKLALEALRALSRPVRTHQERVQVAALSAHNDAAIGEMVASAVEKVGSEGVITLEESKGTETTVEVVEGMQFDRGYLSAYFVTDPARQECVLEDSFVLLYDKRLSTLEELVPLLEQVVKEGRPLLVVAEDVEAEALATLVVNRLRGTLPCVAVKAPGFGDNRRAMLEDMAVLTGGQLVAGELGRKLDSVKISDLGRARRVVVTRETTLLVGGAGEARLISARVEQLRRQADDSKSDYEREKLQERIAKLSGGVAVIRVGAASETELKARREAFDDAVHAAQAAAAEGFVPGAGLALLRAIPALEREEASVDGDERTGLRILRRALEAPTRQIGENSGLDGGVVVDRMCAGTGNLGLDAARGVYVDLVEAGIIDATKVVRLALENAVSVASVLLLTEATLVEEPEPEHEAHRERSEMQV